MRECKAGGNHILYKMATGFQRLLERNGNNAASATAKPEPTANDSRFSFTAQQLAGQEFPDSLAALAAVANGHAHANVQRSASRAGSLDFVTSAQQQHMNGHTTATASAFDASASFGMPAQVGTTRSSDWPLDDDMLWNMVGTEYDLLANAPDTDMNMNFYAF
jgi:hypothetical protein